MLQNICKTNESEINYNDYIGRYFQRDMGDSGDYSVCEINDFDGEYFRVTEYYLTLGASTKEINQRKLKDFVIAKNFKEITKEEFDVIKCLCIEPFVTIWNENEIPYHCREFKGESK